MRKRRKAQRAEPHFRRGDRVMDRVTGRKGQVVRVFQLTLTREQEGGYTVLVPGLPGCVSYGRSVEEAVENATEAIEVHLENLAVHKQPIPEGQERVPVITTLVQVAAAHVQDLARATGERGH